MVCNLFHACLFRYIIFLFKYILECLSMSSVHTGSSLHALNQFLLRQAGWQYLIAGWITHTDAQLIMFIYPCQQGGHCSYQQLAAEPVGQQSPHSRRRWSSQQSHSACRREQCPIEHWNVTVERAWGSWMYMALSGRTWASSRGVDNVLQIIQTILLSWCSKFIYLIS